MGSVTQALKKG